MWPRKISGLGMILPGTHRNVDIAGGQGVQTLYWCCGWRVTCSFDLLFLFTPFADSVLVAVSEDSNALLTFCFCLLRVQHAVLLASEEEHACIVDVNVCLTTRFIACI